MYLGIFVMICVATLMYRIAEFEKRRPWLWAAIGVLWTMAILQFFDVGLLSVIACLGAAYLSMFVVNLLRPK